MKVMPDEAEMIEAYLSGLWGRRVKIIRPERGEKRALLELAVRDVAEMTKTIEEREKNKEERKNELGREMHSVLAELCSMPEYSGEEYRVEAYDISNTNGVDTVGAMVVFDGLKPDRKSYRRFKIRTIEGPNDYGSMDKVTNSSSSSSSQPSKSDMKKAMQSSSLSLTELKKYAKLSSVKSFYYTGSVSVDAKSIDAVTSSTGDGPSGMQDSSSGDFTITGYSSDEAMN